MTFPNRKKTFLEKLDKSKKGELDQRLISLLDLINSQKDYFTTSSCSGRVLLYQTTGKKNETTWLRVSHQPITKDFFDHLEQQKELVWLRLEPFITHVACQDLDSALALLNQAKTVFKKSSLLSAANKIIVELKGSEFLELPLAKDQQFLIKEKYLELLIRIINRKLKRIWQNTEKLEKIILEKSKKRK